MDGVNLVFMPNSYLRLLISEANFFLFFIYAAYFFSSNFSFSSYAYSRLIYYFLMNSIYLCLALFPLFLGGRAS